jgi:hypothetical protein
MESIKPRYTVTIGGQKLGLQFDQNTNPTKMGIKLQFVLPEGEIDPQQKQDLTQKISTALQKRFGEAGITITLDDRVAYENVIGFTVPLDSIADILVKVVKGEK